MHITNPIEFASFVLFWLGLALFILQGRFEEPVKGVLFDISLMALLVSLLLPRLCTAGGVSCAS